jgi:hypothetical protein
LILKSLSADISSCQRFLWPVGVALASTEIFRQTRRKAASSSSSSRRRPGPRTTGVRGYAELVLQLSQN